MTGRAKAAGRSLRVWRPPTNWITKVDGAEQLPHPVKIPCHGTLHRRNPTTDISYRSETHRRIDLLPTASLLNATDHNETPITMLAIDFSIMSLTARGVISKVS